MDACVVSIVVAKNVSVGVYFFFSLRQALAAGRHVRHWFARCGWVGAWPGSAWIGLTD